MGLRKSVEALQAQSAEAGLHRALGPVALVLLGIGGIVGAGIYVVIGVAAANFAGPAVVLSFVIAAIACLLIGLCYAELSAILPSAGASYGYAYACLGEGAAWALGWMIILEFGLGSALLAVGFAGYLASILAGFGIHLPAALSASTLQVAAAGDVRRLAPSPSFNLVALASVLAVALVLRRGIRESASVSGLLVGIKVSVLVAFVLFGFARLDPHHWVPFVPPNEGGFHYGVPGIFRAASLAFFAYIGFEGIASTASEARQPRRDVPIGIFGALTASTLLYAAVGLVMTGLVPFRELDVPDPIAVAVRSLGSPGFALVLKLGALTGLASVLLMNTYAQSRVCFAMSADGLLPPIFSRLHPRFATPAAGTIVIAVTAGMLGGILPLSLLADLVSVGTAFVFLMVAVCVMVLRGSRPELPRPFRVPFGGMTIGKVWFGLIPVLAIAACVTLMGPVLFDLLAKSARGDWLPLAILCLYVLAGITVYCLYGRRHSRLRRERIG